MAVAHSTSMTEPQFAELVNAIAADPDRRDELIELLREENPLYHGRGGAAIVRMRGWVLVALAHVGLSESALVFVLEELDTGMDAYLVAAAARALRTYPHPAASLAPFILRAIANIRYREEPISFEEYGDYAAEPAVTSPLHELLATLAWLGPQARGVLREIDALLSSSHGLPQRLRAEVERIAGALRSSDPTPPAQDCCQLPAGLRNAFAWPWKARRATQSIAQTTFEDHDGSRVTFAEYFKGRPSIVVFFYTRCDNPQKCSLTITKLARIQKLLEARGLSERICTAAITYDPAYDDSDRIRGYGLNRGARLGENHRMLRTTEGFEALREHFRLGVNYVSSLVNRHRLEVFILDGQGRTAATFERIHWSEEQVVERARDCLRQRPASDRAGPASAILGTLASLGIAFFPKCPVCWSAYLSVFGIAGLQEIPYTPWLIPVLAVLMLISLASAVFRAYATRRYWPVLLVFAGVFVILGLKVGVGWDRAALPGVILTLAGSLGGALSRRRP